MFEHTRKCLEMLNAAMAAVGRVAPGQTKRQIKIALNEVDSAQDLAAANLETILDLRRKVEDMEPEAKRDFIINLGVPDCSPAGLEYRLRNGVVECKGSASFWRASNSFHNKGCKDRELAAWVISRLMERIGSNCTLSEITEESVDGMTAEQWKERYNALGDKCLGLLIGN